MVNVLLAKFNEGLNGFMAIWLFGTLAEWGNMHPVSQAEQVGAGLGMAIGLGVKFSIWACVAIVTSIFVLLTRGRKEIIEVE